MLYQPLGVSVNHLLVRKKAFSMTSMQIRMRGSGNQQEAG
jgi:hypothetical protein